MLQIQAHDAILRRRGEGFETSPAPNRNGSHEDRVMAIKALPSPEVLRQLLRYEPETGRLFWRERGSEWFRAGVQSSDHTRKIWNAKWSGREAFLMRSTCGHNYGRVLGERYMAHRIIWAMMVGDLGANNIDHISGDKTDNRLENLRCVSPPENMRNCKLRVDNASGVTGVRAYRGGYAAEIAFEGRRRYLGKFHTLEEAKAARKAAERKLGFHENHGRAICRTPALTTGENDD